MSLNTAEDFFGKAIHVYTRSQAIADGVLVPVAPSFAAQLGLRLPVAFTAEAWGKVVTVNETEVRLGMNESTRLWDALYIIRTAIACASDRQNEILVVFNVQRDATTIEHVSLKVVCGPGDDGEPVLTVMLPHQD